MFKYKYIYIYTYIYCNCRVASECAYLFVVVCARVWCVCTFEWTFVYVCAHAHTHAHTCTHTTRPCNTLTHIYTRIAHTQHVCTRPAHTHKQHTTHARCFTRNTLTHNYTIVHTHRFCSKMKVPVLGIVENMSGAASLDSQMLFECIISNTMGWLRLVGSLKLYVSFAKEPYKRDYILQKRPTILRSLLIVATPYQKSQVISETNIWRRTNSAGTKNP